MDNDDELSQQISCFAVASREKNTRRQKVSAVSGVCFMDSLLSTTGRLYSTSTSWFTDGVIHNPANPIHLGAIHSVRRTAPDFRLSDNQFTWAREAQRLLLNPTDAAARSRGDECRRAAGRECARSSADGKHCMSTVLFARASPLTH